MQRKLLFIALILMPFFTKAQVGAGFHYSNLPFLGINYEISDRFRPELRIGTDTFLEDVSLEGVVTYDLLDKPDYELYLGLGARSEDFSGLVIPFGLNLYPLDNKNFGFHFEVAPIVGDVDILRGSLGFRYRFKGEE
ncbi:hypothetical protein OO013_05205 [Mangrovivirga sp. M17]|uniref:Uncharacterized protein n=1 Tax=Mangrovivirga halotolerans TaxID=2993936 RepID=A0ABT3RNS2_9BACT|nr:hypothetical protein [Mangrovivirga halotolerans]MCX2743251.1 hypothetical protein [Mangrovivirga halotolerans]